MADKSKISWTDATWNPVRGCSRVSEGCRNCYAEQQAARIVRMGKGAPTAYDGLVSVRSKVSGMRYKSVNAAGSWDQPRWTGVVRLAADTLAQPLRWSAPRRIFVNSMSDLFHEGLADEDIDRVLAVMLLAPRHTFQVLTKRAARLRAYMTDPSLYERVLRAAGEFRDARPELNQIAIDNPTTCPKPWIWFGVSVENQAAADERIPELLATPAMVRFLSCEPLLGPVFIEGHLGDCNCLVEAMEGAGMHAASCPATRPRVDWVIAGSESGHGARPCDTAWFRSLRDQCADASVPFFLKQAVEDVGDAERVCDQNGDEKGCGRRIHYHVHNKHHTSVSCGCTIEGAESANWSPPVGAGDGSRRKPGGVIELPYLDGVQHKEMPQ